MTNLNHIKKFYKMPFLKRGLTVVAQGLKGRIVSFSKTSPYIHVKFPHSKRIGIFYPTWQMAYYDKSGKLLAKYED